MREIDSQKLIKALSEKKNKKKIKKKSLKDRLMLKIESVIYA